MKINSTLPFLIFTFLNVVGCSIFSTSKVAVTYSLPIKHSETRIEIYSSTFYKTNYKDVIIYDLPFRETFQLNGILQKDTIKYAFFIFKLNDKEGYYFDSLNTPNIKKKNVDSLLNTSALKSLNIDTILSIISDSNIEPINKNIFVKKGKINDPGYDSVYLYFNNKLLNLNYSFSHNLDSIYNSKLFKVHFIMKKINSENSDYKNKFRVISYEAKKCNIVNENTLEILYQKFKLAKMHSAPRLRGTRNKS